MLYVIGLLCVCVVLLCSLLILHFLGCMFILVDNKADIKPRTNNVVTCLVDFIPSVGKVIDALVKILL